MLLWLTKHLCWTCFAWSYWLAEVTAVSDTTARCSQSDAGVEENRKSGSCHLQTNRETSDLSWSWFANSDEDAARFDCQAACDKTRTFLLQETKTPQCMPYCADNGCPCLISWSERCELNSCAACTECTGNPVPTEDPTMPPGTPTEQPTEDPTMPPGVPTEVPTVAPTAYPTVTPTEMPTLPVCTNQNVPLSWKKASKLDANLGNLGPDVGASHPWISFIGLGEFNNKPINVAITNLTQYTPPSVPPDAGKSGQKFKLGVKGGTKVMLSMKFQDDDLNPVTLPEVHLTLLDIDQSQDGKMTEIIRMPSTGVIMPAGTEVATTTLSSTNQIQFTSTTYGPGCDNPADLNNLEVVTCDGVTTDQKKRAALLVYKGVNEIKMEFEATCDGTCTSGRIFLIGWGSSLEADCPGAPTEPPTVLPMPAPTKLPTPTPTHTTYPTPTPPTPTKYPTPTPPTPTKLPTLTPTKYPTLTPPTPMPPTPTPPTPSPPAGGPCRGNDSRCPNKNKVECDELERQGTDCRWQWNGDGCCIGDHQECTLSNPTRCNTGKTLSGKSMKCTFIQNGDTAKANHYMYTCGHRRRVPNGHINDPLTSSDPYDKNGDGCKCTQNDAQSCYGTGSCSADYTCDHNGCSQR